MIKKVIFSIATLVVFAVLFTSCQSKVNTRIEKVVSFDTTISVPSCLSPILTNIYNCTTHKKSGEKVIGWEQMPDRLYQVHSSKRVPFYADGAPGASNSPIGIGNGGYDNDVLTDPVTSGHWYDDGTWFMNGIGWLFLLLLLIGLLALAGHAYSYWKRNYPATSTGASKTESTEGFSANYKPQDIKDMLDKISKNGGHISHNIHRDNESLFVKVYSEGPVVIEKVKRVKKEEKKGDESAAK